MNRNETEIQAPPFPESLEDGLRMVQAIQNEVAKVAYGPESHALVQSLIVAILADGHVLVEGPPGAGKTFVCRALATTLGGGFQRVQITPDLLPSDIMGFPYFNQETGIYEYRHGPIYHPNNPGDVILLDEINRATPKTQAALLEIMDEYQISTPFGVFDLPDLFVIMATMNPLEHEGVYDLPEAQLDRFLMKLIIGDVSEEMEVTALRQKTYRKRTRLKLQPIQSVTSPEKIVALREEISEHIIVHERVTNFIHKLADSIRKHKLVKSGPSLRGTMSLQGVAQVSAMLHRRTFVKIEEDVIPYAETTLAHRLVVPNAVYLKTPTPQADIINEVLDGITWD